MIFKKQDIPKTLAFIYLLPLLLISQSFEKSVEDIAGQLQSVETSKAQYSQDIKGISKGYVALRITELDSKGDTEAIEYNFSFADVDANTVRAITKKDIIMVQLLIKSQQKLIKKIEDSGDDISYVDEVSIYAKDIDNGRDIVAAIKAAIPISETIEDNKLSLTTYQDHLNWLKENVVEVDYSKTQYTQKLDNTSKLNGYVEFDCKKSSKSKTDSERYMFNFALLNPNSINFKIKNDEFFIEVENRRGLKTIKTFENGEQQNFSNSLEFYAASVENGKDIYKVLKAIIPLAEKAFENKKPDVSTRSKAINYLNKIMENVSGNDKSISQNIKNECVTEFNQKLSTSKDTEDHTYNFNFIDINADNMDFDSNRDLLYVTLNTKQQHKYIKHIENGEIQNYTEDIKLYVNAIEEAMIAIDAIKNTIAQCETESQDLSNVSLDKGLQELSNTISTVSINEDNYEQSLELIDAVSYTHLTLPTNREV